MNVLQLVNTLKKQKVRLEVAGSRLLCHMPSEDYKMPLLLQQAIRSNKRELLEFLQSLNNKPAMNAAISVVERSQSGYGLSSQQERVWFTDQFEQGVDCSYNNAGTITFDGKLNVDTLKSCFNTIIARHESLRTRFFAVDGQPHQTVNQPYIVDCPVFVMPSKDQLQAKIAHLAQQHGQHLFNLSSGNLLKLTLLKLSETQHVLLLNIHHIVSDGWSVKVLFDEVTTLYQEQPRDSDNSPLAPLPVQYIDYAFWQNERKLQGDFERHLTYWQKQLSDAPQQLELATDHTRPRVADNKGQSITFELPPQLTESLNAFGAQHGTTLFMTLMAGFKILLSRYSSQKDILVGTPMANRNQAELEGLIGFFVNTLVMRSQIDNNDTVATLMHKVKQTTLQAYDYQEMPFEMLVHHLNPARSLSYNPIFQVMFILQNTGMGEIELPGLTSRLSHTDNETAKFDLTLEMTEVQGTLKGRLEYATALFEASTINTMIAHYQRLLEGMVDSANLTVGQLPLLSDNEQHYLLHTLNNKQLEMRSSLVVHQLFERQAAKTPASTAVQFSAGALKQQLSYQTLNEKANQLAHYLQGQCIGAGKVVGLRGSPSLELMVGLLGILKTGAAYIPFEPSNTAARCQQIVDDSGLTTVLDTADLQGLSANQPTTNLQLSVSKNDTAYIIYTSGSTGKPKGVAVTHENLQDYLCCGAADYYNESLAGSLLVTSHGFDISVPSLYLPLIHGDRVDMLDRNDVFNQLVTVLSNPALSNPISNKVTVLASEKADNYLLRMTPNHVLVMLEMFDGQTFEQAHVFVVGGEAFDTSLASKLQQQFPNSQIFNHYGPSEGTVGCAMYDVTANKHQLPTPLPIGKPLNNATLLVLDCQRHLLPTGCIGELYIGGPGVAKGYVNQPELTASSFIQSPFAKNQRLYKTGDLVRHLKSGDLEFIGRIDHQVKIRGYRIELGEIEYQLGQCAGVDSAVVSARDTAAGVKQLVAYIKEAAPVTIETMQQTLAKALPDYMVPSAFVFIKQWPLNANGKLDKKALPAPDDSQSLSGFVAPTSQTEHLLVGIWAKLLKIDAAKLGINANFFALGGDSILSIQLVSRAACQDMAFTVKQLFEYQTIDTLARFVDAQTHQQKTAPQGPVNGELTLLPIQHRFFTDATDLHHYNQSVMLTTPESFDSAWLPTIVEQLYRRHDALRLRFESIDGDWRASHQQLDPAMVSLSIVQGTDLSGVDGYQASLSLTGHLFKTVHFAADNRLLLIIHHLVVDGVSWRILLEDIESICADLIQDKTPTLPAKTASYQQWGEWLTDYAASDALLSERDYWVDVVTKDVPSLPCLQTTSNNININQTRFEFDQTTTTQLLQQAAKAYRSQINELLLAGLLLGFNQWSGNAAIRIDLEGHGRQELDSSEQLDLSQAHDLSQTIGWFTSVYPLVLNAQSNDIASLICAVKAQYRAMPNDGIGYGILKYLANDEALQNTQQADILFNYLGQFDDVFGDDNFLKASTDGIGQTVSPRRKPRHGLVFNGMVSDGKLHFDLSFDANRFTAQSIDALTAHLHDALNAVVSHCLEPNVGRLTPCDFPQAKINQQQLSQLTEKYDHAIEDIYPATAMQQGLLFQSDLDSGAYVSQLLLTINCGTSSEINSDKYRQAWQQVTALHEVLNTAFVDDNKLQLVLKGEGLQGVVLPWHQQDLTDLSAHEQQRVIAQYREQDKATGFDATKAPLTRVAIFGLGTDSKGKPHSQVLWTYHHALIDGWCLPLLLEQVSNSYQGLPLTKPRPYRSHVAWLESQNTQAALDFWQQQLSGIEQPTPLPERNTVIEKPGIQTAQLTLTQAETSLLTQLARETKTTVNVVMQAAWGYLLSAYSRETSVVFGTTVSGRPADLVGVEQMIGLFINTIAVRVDVLHDTPLTDWLQGLHRAQVASDEYSYLGLSDIQRAVGLPSNASLFDSLFVFENYPVDPMAQLQTGLALDKVENFGGTSFGLTLTASLSGTLNIKLQSQCARFDEATTNNLVDHLHQLLISMTAGVDRTVDRTVSQLSMLTAHESDYLLNVFNRNRAEFVPAQCIHEMFEQQADDNLDGIALTFENQSLSYKRLNEKANQLAHYLREKGVKADTLVGLSLSRSFDLVIGILAILKAGGAYVPLDPNYPQDRLDYMVKDSGIELVLDQKELNQDLQNYSTSNLTRITPHSLAYVIYTSGSTGNPKGVMVEHHNVVRLLQATQADFNFGSNDVWTLFHSYAFDFSVWELWGALAYGGRLVIVPGDMPKAVDQFYQLLVDEKVTVLNQTPSAFNQLNSVDALQQADLSLRAVIFGGEALNLQQLSGWVERHGDEAPHLVNMYGITETTVHVTYRRILAEDIAQNRGSLIGKPLKDLSFYVLNDQLNPVPVGVCGEIFVGGSGVARGYLNQEALTATRFIHNPHNVTERLYRTGDLARLLPDGEIEYLGRMDEQVKIRGFRIELGEIEHQLTQLPQVESAVVVAREDRLVAYFICDAQADAYSMGVIREQMQAALPQHMVPSFFVVIDQWPLTANGKTDYKALPSPDAVSSIEYAAPATTSELKLVQIWSELLNINADKISNNANFFACGGHSLLMMRLVGEVRAQWGVELAIREVFDTAQLNQLAELIDNSSDKSTRSSVVATTRSSNQLPASFAQQRLWFIDQMDGSSEQYNMHGAVRFNGAFDEQIIEQAFARIVARHEPLRTVFVDSANGVQQLIRETVDFKINRIEASSLADVERAVQTDANRPFDLAHDIMLRIGVVRLSKDEGVMLFNMHHIAGDGWSMGLLINEFTRQYQAINNNQANPFEPLAIQYADYALWQRDFLLGDKLKSQLSYWETQLDSLAEVHSLPLDHARPKVQTFNCAKCSFEIDQSTLTKLESIALDNNATLFMLLHGAFSVLLCRHGGGHASSHDIVIGVPVANRLQKELEQIIGFFVNTLVLRTDSSNSTSFTDFLQHVKQVNLDAQANQDVPFEHLVERLQPTRSTAHAPLIQIMFTMDTNESYSLELPDVRFEILQNKETVAKFELALNAIKTEQGLSLRFDYNSDLFDSNTIDVLGNHLISLLKGISVNPQASCNALPMLSDQEQDYLLHTLNDTAVDYPPAVKAAATSIQQLFEQQVEKTPNSTALVFDGQTLSYSQLNQKANQMAHYLRSKGVKPETLVGLYTERTPGMIIAMLAIFKAGGAYLPLDPSYPQSRLDYIIDDSNIDLLLDYSVLSVDDQPDTDLTLLTGQSPNNLAYVIYTSGSTGQPKGVMVEQGNLINAIAGLSQQYQITEHSKVLQLISPAFDVSVSEIFMSLTNGAEIHLAPESRLLPGDGLAEVLFENQITHLSIASAALAALPVRADLALEVLIVGGEVSPQAQIDKWSEQARYFLAYGPTETTICSSTIEYTAGMKNTSIGKPIANVEYYVMQDSANLTPLGAIGELYIGGKGVARGYLNRDELTKERFIQNPFKDNSRLYQTGDLVRYLPDHKESGQLEFIGRVDEQVKIRGLRIELGEIEQQLLALPSVEAAVVLAKGDLLIAYVVCAQQTNTLRQQLAVNLPDYMVPQQFITLDKIPLTTNGKVDKRALPSPDESQLAKETVAPVTPTEIALADIWAELLNIDYDKLSTTANFFECGGHSLLSVRLVGEVRTRLGVELVIRDIFDTPTLALLAVLVDSKGADAKGADSKVTEVKAIERTSNQLIASFAQQRLWFIEQMSDESVSQYNMPGTLRFDGTFDEQIIEQAFARIVERHEPLRTVFVDTDAGVQQVIRQSVDFKLSRFDLAALDPQEQQRDLQQLAATDAVKVFDLEQDLMLTVAFVRLTGTQGVLLLNMHHIASDGWSMGLLVKEFCEQYRAILTNQANPLAPLTVQYADYAQWQRTYFSNEVLGSQLDYWAQKLADLPQVHGLPLDHPRPKVQGFDGALHRFSASSETLNGLKQLALANNATLFMVLQGAFSLLLSRHSSNNDIVLGVPVANRMQKELEDVIGFFVNTLVLRTDCSGNPSFSDYLQHVKTVNLDAQANQDVPFEHLVERLQPTRSTAHSPLFQVMFSMDTNQNLTFELPELVLSPQIADDSQVVSKYELTLNASETDSGLSFSFEYNIDLFDAGTMATLAEHFSRLLGGIVANGQSPIGSLPMLSDGELHYLQHTVNPVIAKQSYPTIHQSFEAQATLTPNNIAVVCEGEQLCYQALNEQANQVAHYLIKQGVKPDMLVGLSFERSTSMIVALLGILKAGGAYLPLDPTYPQTRIDYMVQDSAVEWVLTQGLIDAIDLNSYSESNPQITELNSQHLAYVIYTSGSTGQPKGVMVTHENLQAYYQGAKACYEVDETDNILQFSAMSFDIFVEETFLALCSGASLVLRNEQMLAGGEHFWHFVSANQISVVSLPTAYWHMLCTEQNICLSNKQLRLVIIGGEAMSLSMFNRWQTLTSGADIRVLNTYGPTEATVIATVFDACDLTPQHVSVPIGKPVANSQCFVLDKNGNNCPIGVQGELHIGGLCLARGYLGQPELTEQKFSEFTGSSRLYKTGDIARYLPDGNLEFVGRLDTQVKIRGFRIELGEIEQQLTQLPQVKSSIVVAREEQLVAYVVGQKELNKSELQQALQITLPEYMIPTFFVMLDALPLTPNGKVDIKALPEPVRGEAQADYVAPATETESQLTKIWAELLKLDADKISATANFFDLGGHSILLMRLLSSIKKTFEVDITLAKLFELSVLSVLAEQIDLEQTEQTQESGASQKMGRVGVIVGSGGDTSLPGEEYEEFEL